MEKGTRNFTALLGLGVLALTGGASEAADRGAPTIVLRLANHAGTGTEELAQAQAETERVFEAMGVRTVWSDAAQGVGNRGCRGVNLSVALLSPEMIRRRSSEGIGDSTLGTAFKAAGRAYIFSERITSLAARTRMDQRVLLGRVIAHEVGHLLLTETGHAHTGIMVAGISPDPAKLRAQFTEEQARAIRAVLEGRARESEDSGNCGTEQTRK